MAKVLITGASGFFGAALLRPAAAAGHQITAVSRTPPQEDVEHIAVDLRDVAATKLALRDWRWDAVIHLAGTAVKGELTWHASVDLIDAHVQLLVHLLSAIPHDWPGRFIHASGAIVYGTPVAQPVSEEHVRRPLHAYGLAKMLAEDILFGSSLTDRWLLRTGGLFSESRISGALFNFARRALVGEPLVVTTSIPPVPWELLHVDDAVDAVLRALAAPSRDPGAINVSYGEPVQIVDIARWFVARASSASTVELVGDAPPVFQADITKARRLIDWTPVSLTSRLNRYWENMRDGQIR